MTLKLAIVLTARLAALAMFLFGLENLFLTRQRAFREVWSFANLHEEWSRAVPLPKKIVSRLFSLNGARVLAALQMILAAGAMLIPTSSSYRIGFALLFAGQFVVQLLWCIRFRGTFNGGSDMLGFVVLTGLIIALWSTKKLPEQLGLIYISIHLIYSYFKAGIAKVRQREWRSGGALAGFMERSLHRDVRALATWLKSHPRLGMVGCWSVLVFELASVVVPFVPKVLPVYLVVAVIFHLSVVVMFGLNRFFWIWMGAWPTIFYVSSLMAAA